MKRYSIGILIVTVLFLSASTVFGAETTATIIGGIHDDKGAPLPGATITALNTATNLARSTNSEASGSYRVALLPPGIYTITVEISGFAKEVRTGIELTIGKEVVMDFHLKLSTAGEVVEVSGETPLIDSTKSALAATVEEESIKSLPLNGRDYTQLSLLAPGVRTVTLTNYGQFQIGGQRGDSVNYTIDGAENNFSYTNESRSSFTQEGIQEFQILTNRFSAEYGRSTSGVINVISKSGTNELHGNGFFFFRNDSLDEPDFFSQEAIDACESSGGSNCDELQAPFDQQQGGATLGGPIVKDKTFFFAAYEQVNTDRNLSVVDLNEPTGTRFRPAPIDRKLLTAKGDHNINSDNSMVFRYNLEDRHTNGFYAGGIYVDGVDQNIRAQSFAVSETAVLSNNTYNEVLFQYGRYLREDTPEVIGVPTEFRPSTVTGQHYCCPQRFLENRYEILDTFTKVFNTGKGDHTMKFGGDFIYVDSQLTFEQYIAGSYFFGTDDPFDPNNPDTFPTFFELGVGNATNDDSNKQFSAFVQDDWRMNDNFTLNLGLRYDIETFSGPTSSTPVAGTDIVLGEIPDVDANNFAPRLGFTWDPWAKGQTVIRGGYGRYFKPILHNVYNNALLFDGQRYLILSVGDSAFLAQFYPGIPSPDQLEATPGDVRPMQSADIAYTDQISIGFQHELAKDYVVSADYVYVHGANLTRERNLNAPRDLVNPEDPPFPDIGRFRLLLTDATSDYHALQLGMQKRYSNNLMFTASYTLSKTEEDAADFFSISEPNDQFNLDAERGPGTHDQRHVFAFSGIYDLPKSFQLSGIVRGASGIPINIILVNDHNSDGFLNDRPDAGANGGFAPPPADRPGNLGRNSERGDGFFQVDLRVAKNFNWDQFRLELLFEVFNLFNRTNFNFRPGTVNRKIDFDDPSTFDTLGTATEVFDPRQIQFGIKFDF